VQDHDELLQLSQQLLDAIAVNDWAVYEHLCATDLTAFEPEARGQRVAGLDFHRFYFDLGPVQGARCTTMVDPQVRMLGEDAALVTYIRLVQSSSDQGTVTSRCEESRVWVRTERAWKHVHFHRSQNE